MVIKLGMVLFLGGQDMTPIITIQQANVEAVSMSPCERYVLTYAPKSNSAYTVWDFRMVSVLREFDKKPDERADSYKWSHDGNYIAKSFRTKKESGKIKEGITVYELPSMDTLKDPSGRATGITVNGIY